MFIVAIVGLGLAVAFSDLKKKVLAGLLFVTAVCFAVATFITAYVAKSEENKGGNDDDNPKLLSECIKNDKNNDLYNNFTGAVVASVIIKVIGMAASLIFVAAEIVQFLNWANRDLPESGINDFLEGLGDDVGDYKWLAIVVSIVCNVIFNDEFVKKLLDKNKSAWKVVGLELLYLILENIDNYAVICLGNVSKILYNASPIFALVIGLMFCQLYGSDLWVVGKNVSQQGLYIIEAIFNCVGDKT